MTSEIVLDARDLSSGLRHLAVALMGAALTLPSLATGQSPAGSDRPERIALRSARMIDVEEGSVIQDAVVLVEGLRIVAAGTREQVSIPEGVRLLDLGTCWLVPGLVDAHVHLAWGAAADAGGNDAPPPGAAEALATLRAGFTTVRNLGSTGFADVLLREAIDAGEVPGPRMLVAGPGLGAPGGTCAGVFAGEGVVRSAEEARAKVRELAEAGVDWIKFCAGGGVLATPADQDACELSPETMRAIVEEAHALSLRVAAHAQGPRAIATAVQAGVDSIEHGALLDDPAARAMKERGTVLVPTLYRLDWNVAAAGQSGGAQATRLAQARDDARAHVKRAIELGVPLVLGTDATVFPHGLNARELGVLVELGLSPLQAMRAATLDAARLLGLEREIGSIAPGKRADLIAVAADPLADVRALEHVVWVMRDGRVVKDER
jgi:imidazolonepropionase-like amidohydrolase